MNYRRLGKTDLMVSEIGFGGWGIGGKDWGPTDDRESERALAAALDAGITFFDTAPSYGRSEALIASAVKWRRDKVVICTKTEDMEIESSLRLFGHIDVLLLHHHLYVPYSVPPRMAKWIEEGKIRSWGISAKAPEHGLDAIELGAEVVEANLSMMDTRAIDCGLLEKGAGIIARTPLNFGFLSGTITPETIFPQDDHRWKWPRTQILAWIDHARLCLGDTPPGRESVRKALAWVLEHDVSTVIVGMTKADEVRDNT